MSKKERFFTTETLLIKAKVGDIWAIWVDINGWPRWDDGIETTKFSGNFREGNSFELQPKGGESLTVTLCSVTPGEEFIDETILPFGIIRNIHRMRQIEDKVELTHEIEALINKESAPFFSKEIWTHMQEGLAKSLQNLKEIVEN